MRIETLLQDPELQRLGVSPEQVQAVCAALGGEGENLEAAAKAMYDSEKWSEDISSTVTRYVPWEDLDESFPECDSPRRQFRDRAFVAAPLIRAPLLAKVATLEAERERLTGVLNLANETTASWRRKCDTVEAERDRLRGRLALAEDLYERLCHNVGVESELPVDTLLGETGR